MKGKKHINNIKYTVITILIILLIASGCSKKQEKPKPPEMNEKMMALMDIDEKIEDITKDIESIQKEMEKPEEKKKEQDNEKGNKEEQGQESEQKDKEVINIIEEENQKQNREESKEEKIKGMWEKVNNTIKTVHSIWNSFEPNAVSDGVEKESIKGFEDSLNALTIAGEHNKDVECLIAANTMTFYVGNFFEFYEDKGQSEMMKTKFYIRQTYLMAEINDWKQAEESIKKSKPVANRLKQRLKLDKNGEDVFKKLKLSLDDMENVLQDKNKELLMIKRDIALKNLEALKEASK